MDSRFRGNDEKNLIIEYNDIASKIGVNTGAQASRQAYHQRMGAECQEFFEKILASVMASKGRFDCLDPTTVSDAFSRILVQDSTVIRLPLRLFEVFSGVKNAHSAVCNARIQGIYDLLSKRFVGFSIDPYSRNDLSAAFDIDVEPGDLVLRDRGYFSVPNMLELKENGADSISRYKHKTLIYDVESGKEINLLEYLRKHGSMDREVLVGKEKCKVRIAARPVDEETANLRRMKAKKESSSKKPSEELLALMSWTIFFTTVEIEALTFDMILKLYGLRWRIENIFKTWKSHFSFNKIHNVSQKQLRILLTARLTMIVFIYQRLFRPLSTRIKERFEKKRLSLMKFSNHIRKNLEFIYELLDIQNILKETEEIVVRYCTYDSRKRKNFETQLEQILLETNELGCHLLA